MGLIPGLGRSPGVGNGNPLQYSCLENLMDRGAWQAIVRGVTKSWIQLSEHTYARTHIQMYTLRRQLCEFVSPVKVIYAKKQFIECGRKSFFNSDGINITS